MHYQRLLPIGEGDSLSGYTDENHLHLWEIILDITSSIMKISGGNLFLGKILSKIQFLIFRVAILKQIQQYLNSMGTLIKKVTSDSAYLWPKTLKSKKINSGFPKKACQGCHIS